nr:Sec-independent protein translocase component tatA/E [Paralia sulcata]
MNISFSQLVLLILLGILFFGDISYITKNINILINNLKNYFKK